MINVKYANRFCCEDISLIENYDIAKSSNEIWDCHHRLETDLGLSRQELVDSEMYYGVEAKYLIFLSHSDHTKLHKTGIKFTQEHRNKIGDGNRRRVTSHKSRNKGKHRVYDNQEHTKWHME